MMSVGVRFGCVLASDQVERSQKDIVAAVERELEASRYEASPKSGARVA
jgi:hypothetical protein